MFLQRQTNLSSFFLQCQNAFFGMQATNTVVFIDHVGENIDIGNLLETYETHTLQVAGTVEMESIGSQIGMGCHFGSSTTTTNRSDLFLR